MWWGWERCTGASLSLEAWASKKFGMQMLRGKATSRRGALGVCTVLG